MTKLKHLSALLAGCLLVGSMSGSALCPAMAVYTVVAWTPLSSAWAMLRHAALVPVLAARTVTAAALQTLSE